MKKAVSFELSGEFITDLARDWLYVERRPYNKVMDLLLACMCSSEYSELELQELAQAVLSGKKKLTGNTRDDSFCMIDDNVNIVAKYPYYFQKNNKQKRIKKNSVQRFEKRPCVNETREPELGWLSPNGKFFEVSWGNHEKWAIEYISKHFPDNKLYTGYGDFLTNKGWILLHDPSRSGVRISCDCYKKPTKKQKEFLYDYFIAVGMAAQAHEVYGG